MESLLVLNLWKWVATVLAISGGIMFSLNIENITRYGVIPFLLSSIIWFIIGIEMKEKSIIMLNATFIFINVLGVYQWLLY